MVTKTTENTKARIIPIITVFDLVIQNPKRHPNIAEKIFVSSHWKKEANVPKSINSFILSNMFIP